MAGIENGKRDRGKRQRVENREGGKETAEGTGAKGQERSDGKGMGEYIQYSLLISDLNERFFGSN
jgi:hypothetical protein